jgi:hypothetical protein
MDHILGILGLLVIPLGFAAVCFILIWMPRKKIPSFAAMNRFAKKYLEKYPNTKCDGLRDALMNKYLPDAPGEPSSDHRKVTALYGAGGMAGYALGRWVAEQRHQRRAKLIEQRIDDVLDDFPLRP